MRVPLSWLAEYVELPKDSTPHSVMAELVKVGLEEEGAHGGDLRGPIVVGKVLEFVEEEQSNGKTIRWCQVEVAPGVVNGIVCGARNFFVGDKVVVTLPGAALPGGFEIAARKTYGHISDGMIASSRELGLSDEHHGILRLSSMGLDPEVGTDALELLGLAESAAEVNVTPDRGYCLSIRGIAREFSHASGAKFVDPAAQFETYSGQGIALSVSDSAPIHQKPGCSSFFLLGVSNINAQAATPNWMVNRLKLAGMRSISIAVDITNYVMLELGQPLHAYDAEKLVGGFSVRRANAGESLETLDGRLRDLHPEDLLICDDQGPIGLAGVMGGARTEVSESTTKVILEAASFDPISIARSARRHKLPSEASKRFERGVDRLVSRVAASRAAQLLVELAGGKLDGSGADFSMEIGQHAIEMSLDFPSQLVGFSYSPQDVIATLEAIGCLVTQTAETLQVTPPSWRPDLTHKTDLAEEVARLIGYDKIPVRLPVAPPGRGLTRKQQLRRRALSSLTGAGFTEVLNYPFMSESQNQIFSNEPSIRLENPLQGEFGELRKSLLPGLMLAASRNLSRSNLDLALIEEGSVFLPAKGAPILELPIGNKRPDEQLLAKLYESIPNQPRLLAGLLFGNWLPQGPMRKPVAVDYSHAISAVQLVAKAAGLSFELRQKAVRGFHPGRSAEVYVGEQVVGAVGEIHPRVAKEFYLSGAVAAFELDLDQIEKLAPNVLQASELKVMTATTQDLSLVVDADLPAATMVRTIAEGAGELLESVTLVDDYRGAGIGEGKKSLTFGLVFRASDRTLTQQEASASRDAAVALANQRHGAELRA
ncbi:MAG: phenylalanine--tRNA ligase subunit beta [Actinobacteria bacterium]|nr:phenylalanine--tRNA ligase subunit beta [Actinomycetota bacterium]